MNKLVAKNLTKVFGSGSTAKIAVDNISFEIHEGDVFGLLGPNGAGKTTTMKMLATLIKPTEGEIFYNDKSITDDPCNIRSEFAFLTAENRLYGDSSPSEMFDYFAKLYHLPAEVAQDRKKLLFERFGINEFENKKIQKLSQGMKQKTHLAISVLHDPKFIIFDEPTNGLDVLAAREVREFILEMKAQGKCVIVSTHIFDLIEKTCNKVGLIINGEMLANDTLENVMAGRSLEDAFYDIYTEHLKNKEAES